jgi:ferrous iron transport protein B
MARRQQTRELVIALVGNPNSGKTTVFNELTGSHQHVGNWPGVTVECKEGKVRRDGYVFRIVDLPGIYSLSPTSQEQIIARDFLIENHVDVIVNVIDAANLERNLYLTTQLLELGIGMVVALNMIDMAERFGWKIDLEKFAAFLGVEVVPTCASKGEGIDEILVKARQVAECGLCEPPRSTRHHPEIETELAKLAERLQLKADSAASARWMLIKSIEGDGAARKHLVECSPHGVSALDEVDRTRKHLEQIFGDDIESVIANGRYGFIGGLLRETVRHSQPINKRTITDRIDDILLHRVLGIPIFLALMWLTFKLTFDVGDTAKQWLEAGVAALGAWTAELLPKGPLASLIVDGIIAGVGGVVVFLPNIIVLFTIISLLEDSGYMARAAFLMDRSMHALGLHGKSFIPMLMGFGCNVPAVMATRTLETREDRLLTILVTPLMSCSARLPIYVLFAGAFFPNRGALVILSLYVFGVLLAAASGKLLRKLVFSKAASPFVMELPPYRLPTIKGMVIHVWERSSLFLTKAGTLILAAAIIIWALGALPWGVEIGSEHSLVGYIGRALQPLVQPLGLDWKAAVALVFGAGAKEIVVSTLGVLYSTQENAAGLSAALRQSFTPLTAFVFMVISLIYIPCVATIAAIRRETNSWRWTIFAIVYSLLLAYFIGLAIYRIGLLLRLK